MITILHGDNIVSSRQELIRLKNNASNKEIRDIKGKDLTETDLRQAVESLSLFGSLMLITIENLFSPLGKKEKIIHLYADILNQKDTDADIVLWESKELGKTVLDCFSKSHVQLFKIPNTVFTLLDSIASGNTSYMISAYEKTEAIESSELILYMIQNRVRQLIQVKDGITPQKVSGWQFARLTNQVRSFTMDKLLSMHTKLIELEFSFKSGSSPYTLSQFIKQFIVEI